MGVKNKMQMHEIESATSELVIAPQRLFNVDAQFRSAQLRD